MAAISGWSSKMSFQRNKSKNNHDKDSNVRSTSPGGYSVSQFFGSSPKRRSPPQRSATTQQLSSTPPKYDEVDMSINRSTPTPTAAVPVPPGRTFMKAKLSSSSAASVMPVFNNPNSIKDSHSPNSGVFIMNQGKSKYVIEQTFYWKIFFPKDSNRYSTYILKYIWYHSNCVV